MSSTHQRDPELFDVVNEKDEVVAQAPRQEVHTLELLHRAVHAFVFNHKGEVFLQQRSWTKDTAPGRWVSACSGHVDAGEDYDTAIRREMLEELGIIAPDNMRCCHYEHACRETGNEFVKLYLADYSGEFKLDPEEIIDGKWISTEDLNRWISERPRDFAWAFTHLWARYRDGQLRDSGCT